jgi:hypothetical protein
VEAGQAMRGLLQSLASSISNGTPALLPKGGPPHGPVHCQLLIHHVMSHAFEHPI